MPRLLAWCCVQVRYCPSPGMRKTTGLKLIQQCLYLHPSPRTAPSLSMGSAFKVFSHPLFIHFHSTNMQHTHLLQNSQSQSQTPIPSTSPSLKTPSHLVQRHLTPYPVTQYQQPTHETSPTIQTHNSHYYPVTTQIGHTFPCSHRTAKTCRFRQSCIHLLRSCSTCTDCI